MSSAAEKMLADPDRELLRHTLATVAYRGGKAMRGAPDTFAQFRVSPKARTPVEILAHMGDLMDWALSISQGRQRWRDSTPLSWDAEMDRFFAALEAFDTYLASALPCISLRNSFSRAQSPMRLRISVRSQCCAGWQARP